MNTSVWKPDWRTHVCNLARKEGNVLFNYALFNDDTFYLQLNGVRHIVKDHSDSKRINPLPPHGLLLVARYHIPRPLLHQSWRTDMNKKDLNGSDLYILLKTPFVAAKTLLVPVNSQRNSL